MDKRTMHRAGELCRVTVGGYASDGAGVARESSGCGGVRCLVKRDLVPAGWELERPTVEDVVLFLVKGAKKQ